MWISNNSRIFLKLIAMFITSIFWVILLHAVPAISETIPVYILAGQSNMFGLGKQSEIESSMKNWLNGKNNDVFFLYNGDKRESLSKSGRIIKNIVAPNKLLNNIESGSGYDFGPELKFAQEMRLYHGKRIAVIKYSKNNMQLSISRDNESFFPGTNTDLSNQGKYFKELLETINIFLELLKTKGEPSLAGMVWMQGETDALSYEKSKSYEKNLILFIDRIRKEFNRSDLPFIIGKISPLNEIRFTNLIRAAQNSICKFRKNVFCVETVNLDRYFPPCSFDNYPDSLCFCNVHFNARGQIELGKAFADAMKTLIPK
jgi:hypothetical protein